MAINDSHKPAESETQYATRTSGKSLAGLLCRTKLANCAGGGMNHPACLVGLFAAHGFLLDQNAVSYLRVHDYQEVLNRVSPRFVRKYTVRNYRLNKSVIFAQRIEKVK